ncbi:MAG: acyltransferase domain-containing protein [Anaerolineae bacterium]|nr:acyltransferase domain-containing protein [Anaerolineae bacterium]
MLEPNIHLHHTPIAIIGMGALMPQARNLREFWNNIIGKVDCITDVPESRWRVDDYYDPDPAAPDKTYCKRGGFIPDVDFDPMEFGLPPNILEVTDVSQILSLLVAKEALTDAGYIQGADEIRERTGVILGVGSGQKLITPLASRLQYPIWDEVLQSYGIGDEDRPKIIERMKLAYIRWEENSFPGMLGNVVAGRIANRFDLGGTNCVVDAACASTMAALKMALSELTEHRADMMLTGGVDTDNSIFMYMCFSKTPAFSKGSNPRPFDAESDGMMVGEGIGMMVLKRLEDAERDGDRIYAVIKGLGSSSDGRYKSIYAPRGEGQEKALRRAYEDAGFSPSTVDLVEAHGTGTIAGDTTEVTTIIRYFNQHDLQKQHVALGSVKSQIGHTKASAGAAGLIKTVLALHHKVLPPTLNVEQPNPKFDMPNSAFYINTEARPWVQPADNVPRRAGVSSFGFGGTNFHIVMEEYRNDHQANYRIHSTPQTIILTANTAGDLQTHIKSIIDGLQSGDSDQHFLNLVRASRTANILMNAPRVGFVAATPVEAASLLQITHDMLASKPTAEDWQHPKGIFYRRNGLNVDGHIVALFAGQGSQYLNMGRELALNFPEIRQSFAQLDSLMKQDGKVSLSSVVFPRHAFQADEIQTQEAALQSTDYAQPAIGAVSAGMYRLLQKAGFRANFTAGHSFGELTALWAAGALQDDDYAMLVKARGAAMAPPQNVANFDAGTMIAVSGDVEAIEREIANLSGVQVANRNSRTQVVVAGAKDAVKNAETALKAKGFKVVALSVGAAFHTPLVGHAQKPFAQAINQVKFNTPKIPVYSNNTGKPYPTDPNVIQSMLADHILNPVLFRDEIENIYAAGGTIFVEFGPRSVLTNLVKDILGDRPYVAVALNSNRQKDSDRQLREAAVQLQVLGLKLDSLDPYIRDFEPAVKKKGLNVTMNASNYVSDKTRAVYRDALASGSRITINAAPPVTDTALIANNVSKPVPDSPPDPQPLSGSHTQTNEPAEMNTSLPTLDHTFAEFRDNQHETLRVHEQYMQSQAEYFRIFFELTQQQQTLLASQTLPPTVAESLTQNMLQFHEYQSETLRMHTHYMQQQTEIAQSLLGIISQQYAGGAAVPVATNGNGTKSTTSHTFEVIERPTPPPQPAMKVYQPPISPPVIVPQAAPLQPVAATTQSDNPPAPTVQKVATIPAPANNAVSDELAQAMLRIVGEKTGYPVDMLELSMDMEADLGIDSIKRVEILGAMRDSFPSLPQFSPEALGELRTLQQIVDYMQAQSGGVSAPPAIPVTTNAVAASTNIPTPAAVAVVSTPPPAPTAGVVSGELAQAMLRIVGEKTGYPVDMLELSMDMEADLGIDSIKRVEILGAMRDSFPSLPQFSPEALGELRTLQQIVDYMQAQSGGVSAPTATPTTNAVAASTNIPTPAAAAVVSTPPPVPAVPTTGIISDELAQAMLRIVGEKTGYPVDMLELSMDMEADLGIDSIKRVEILGAMRDSFPSLPQFSPEALGELRTLQQIVDYMQEASRQALPFDLAGSPTTSLTTEFAFPPVNDELSAETYGIERRVVELLRLPSPDFQEFTGSGAVCLITDDGTATVHVLSNQLANQGWKVIVLSLPQAIVPSAANLNGTARMHLDTLDENNLQSALSAITQQHGNIGAFIHLNPVGRGTLFDERDKALVKFAFLMAKHLKSTLNQAGGSGNRRCFITLTRLDGALGTSADNDYSAITGGLFGLIKTLNLEWDRVFCRAVDVEPSATAEQIAAYLIAEMHDPNRLLTEVAYGAQGRVTLTAQISSGVR